MKVVVTGASEDAVVEFIGDKFPIKRVSEHPKIALDPVLPDDKRIVIAAGPDFDKASTKLPVVSIDDLPTLEALEPLFSKSLGAGEPPEPEGDIAGGTPPAASAPKGISAGGEDASPIPLSQLDAAKAIEQGTELLKTMFADVDISGDLGPRGLIFVVKAKRSDDEPRNRSLPKGIAPFLPGGHDWQSLSGVEPEQEGF